MMCKITLRQTMLSQLARAASRRAAAPWCRAGAAAAQSGYATAVLPDLDYDYGALQPAISPQIMELHHSKHHQTYVNNLNVALDQYAEAEAKGNTQKMIALQPAIKFNGGGHVNHSIFWTNMAPPKDCSPPEGALLAAIEAEFGSLDAMKKQFAAQAVGVQGSGWAWLGYDQSKARLAITTTPNQDPCITKGLVPVLGLDVWEHAYYLDYKNVRPDYVGAFWEVTNWNNVAKRYADAGGD